MRLGRIIWLGFLILLMVNVYAENEISPYDIPDRREMESCSCVEKGEYINYYDPDEPFFITLTVANFGEDVLKNVRVSITPGIICVLYLNETSEISRRSSFSQDHSWEKVLDNYSKEDRIAEMFPFTANYSVAETLAPCKDESSDCENIMIRFQHHVHGGCPKYRAQFQSTIFDDSGKPYKTNTGYPLQVDSGYSEDPSCYIAPQDQCGGHSFTRPEETSDEDTTHGEAFDDADSDSEKSDGCSILFL